jgi:hypothetical protein
MKNGKEYDTCFKKQSTAHRHDTPMLMASSIQLKGFVELTATHEFESTFQQGRFIFLLEIRTI